MRSIVNSTKIQRGALGGLKFDNIIIVLYILV